MQSGTVASNGIELFYESRGPENGEAIVFVMGLSAQMVFWPESLLDSQELSVVVPKIRLGGQRLNFSFTAAQSGEREASTKTVAEPEA